jgi:RHS repeat-associated protein
VGNRTSASFGGTIGTCPTMSGGTVSAYAIASGANQISTITTGSAVRTFGYLASGQVSGDQRTATSDYTFAYNNDGRMQTASLNSSGVGSYVYNGFEQRAQKTAGSAVTDFVFDRFGHLLAEANDATGAMLREYIWLDNRPVAMVDDTGASPVVYYVHTDQLGTPQKVTDGAADVVWDGVFDPFGNMVANTGANWGTGVWLSFTWEPTSPQTMPLRFPGQYADSETALNQNWNRDYDPTIGRYVESDPIGLWGGVNTYIYADGSAVRRFDRFGLCDNPDPCIPQGASGPGWVFGVGGAVGIGVGIGAGIVVTGAGEIYLNGYGGLPGPGASIVYASSMSNYAEGFSMQGGYGGAVGWNPSSTAYGLTTPGAAVGYSVNFSRGLCDLLNFWDQAIMNWAMEQADAYPQ